MAERSGESGVTHTDLAGMAGCGATMNSRWSPQCPLPGEGKDRLYGMGAKLLFASRRTKVPRSHDRWFRPVSADHISQGALAKSRCVGATESGALANDQFGAPAAEFVLGKK